MSWSSPSVEVRAVSVEEQREVVRYRADEPGRILVARLAWPGCTATVDGGAVPVGDGPAGLVTVALPVGDRTLVLGCAAPGLRTGALVAAGAALVALAQTALWWWQRSRTRRAAS